MGADGVSMKLRLPALPLDARVRQPLLTALGGVAAGAALGVMVPAPYGAPLALSSVALAVLAAALGIDRRRGDELDALARSVGELNVRLAATRVRLDGLQARVDAEPLREADIAPTRQALSELTAEVGLLGGALRDVAAAVASHDGDLTELKALRTEPKPAKAKAAASRDEPIASAVRSDAAEAIEAAMAREAERQAVDVIAAFEAGGLDVHLQPIAALPQRRTVAYEALARLRTEQGALLGPPVFLPAIARAGLSAQLDAQVLTRVLRLAQALLAKPGEPFVMVNLSAATWADARALQSIGRVLEAYRTQSSRLVIEIPQAVFRALDPTRLGLVGAMAARGVRFGLDQVGDLRLDPVALADRGVRFVKIPAALLVAQAEKAGGVDIVVGDLAGLLRRAGIDLIGERAETDPMVADLIDLDVRLAQGYAISEPRPVKPEALQPQAAKAVSDPPAKADPPAQGAVQNPAVTRPVPPAPTRPAQAPATAGDDRSQGQPPPERLPLRAVLRRA
jgi:cyclic-di-GMP phosphodiesterase TipF (flagellum assembly factor)